MNNLYSKYVPNLKIVFSRQAFHNTLFMNNLLSKSLPNLNILFSRQTVISFSEVRYKGDLILRK